MRVVLVAFPFLLLVLMAALSCAPSQSGSNPTKQDGVVDSRRIEESQQLTLAEYAGACGEINQSVAGETDVYKRVEKILKERKKLVPPDELRAFHSAVLLSADMIADKRSLTDPDVIVLSQALEGEILGLSDDARGTLVSNGCIREE